MHFCGFEHFLLEAAYLIKKTVAIFGHICYNFCILAKKTICFT